MADNHQWMKGQNNLLNG